MCESLSAVFPRLRINLLFLSVDCTCKCNASKASCERCGVTQGRLFEGHEISFFASSSQCTGSWIREIALATVGMYREVMKKLYVAESHK